MFFNVENFFDIEDDYDTEDDEFLPVGFYRWTQWKFEEKRNGIANVIDSADNGTPPALIGLCEVENRYVLQQLISNTPLSKYGYAILHNDSPDPRGIDVALLYLSEQLEMLDSAFIRADTDTLPKDTRDILYAKGVLGKVDTMHIFVNHWSSKRGGAEATEPYRLQSAKIVRRSVDSILNANPLASVILMGDFNDTYLSKPIIEELRADKYTEQADNNELYNLSYGLAGQGKGTSKYKGKWNLVDMFFCSSSLLSSESLIYCEADSFSIFDADFLLEDDKTYGGKKPRRTLFGPRYNGGVSDHLPVYITIKSRAGL